MHNTKKTDTYTNICMYICKYAHACIVHTRTYIQWYMCMWTEKHAHNCSFINVKGFRLLLQHYLINPICGAGEKQNRNMCIDKIPTRVEKKKRKRRRRRRRKKRGKTNLPMYNQFNYFYEIVFSVWFIFWFAFCLLPYPYTLFLTGTTHIIWIKLYNGAQAIC